MSHEQTRREHTAQRDLVIRSLLLSPNRQDRSEERVRARRVKPVVVVVHASDGHEFMVPVVTERAL